MDEVGNALMMTGDEGVPRHEECGTEELGTAEKVMIMMAALQRAVDGDQVSAVTDVPSLAVVTGVGDQLVALALGEAARLLLGHLVGEVASLSYAGPDGLGRSRAMVVLLTISQVGAEDAGLD
jgi:hypothetical protein